MLPVPKLRCPGTTYTYNVITWSGMLCARPRVQVREAANDCAVHEFVVDLALVTTLVAAHQQHVVRVRDDRESFAELVALYEDVVVVLEIEQTDDSGPVRVLFALRQDHFAEFVGNRMPLAREYVGDFRYCSLG